MRHSIEIDRAKMTWSSFKMAGQKWHDRLRSWQPPIVIWCHFANLWCIFKFDIWWTIGWPLSCTNFQETKCLAIIQVSSNEMLKCWNVELKCWNVEMLKSLETSYDDDKATNENQQLSWDLYPSYDTTAAWSLLAFVTFPTALQALIALEIARQQSKFSSCQLLTLVLCQSKNIIWLQQLKSSCEPRQRYEQHWQAKDWNPLPMWICRASVPWAKVNIVAMQMFRMLEKRCLSKCLWVFSQATRSGPAAHLKACRTSGQCYSRPGSPTRSLPWVPPS